MTYDPKSWYEKNNMEKKIKSDQERLLGQILLIEKEIKRVEQKEIRVTSTKKTWRMSRKDEKKSNLGNKR